MPTPQHVGFLTSLKPVTVSRDPFSKERTLMEYKHVAEAEPRGRKSGWEEEEGTGKSPGLWRKASPPTRFHHDCDKVRPREARSLQKACGRDRTGRTEDPKDDFSSVSRCELLRAPTFGSRRADADA
eukprot:scaffold1445_cov235-Pinguiococcus_pyrenoidosus.AAC.10